jgi:hypothetical protein
MMVKLADPVTVMVVGAHTDTDADGGAGGGGAWQGKAAGPGFNDCGVSIAILCLNAT